MAKRKITKGSMISRLNKVFIMQLVFISVATVFGVLGAAKVVEDVLIKEALIGEAEFYWKHKDLYVEFPLPKTMNLTGYVVENEDYSLVPTVLEDITEQCKKGENLEKWKHAKGLKVQKSAKVKKRKKL